MNISNPSPDPSPLYLKCPCSHFIVIDGNDALISVCAHSNALITTGDHENWSLLFKIFIVWTVGRLHFTILHGFHINELLLLFSFLYVSSQTRGAVTSIITAWWCFKPGSAFTPTTQTSAAPPVPVPRKHTPALFKSTTSAGDVTDNLIRFGKLWREKTNHSNLSVTEVAVVQWFNNH